MDSKQAKSYDKLGIRLSQILIRLSAGERLRIDDLTAEFGVDRRTIQRDLNERLASLPIKRENSEYSLEPHALGKICFDDIRRFAKMSGVEALYPSLANSFITKIIDDNKNTPYAVKSYEYENLEQKSSEFEALDKAITGMKKISFRYKAKGRTANPYRLLNKNGVWYLAADEGGVLKNYVLGKISGLIVYEEGFLPSKEILGVIESSESGWFTQNAIEATVRVKAVVAEYFLRRKLLPSQQTLEQNGEYLILSTKVAYEGELLGAVKYWLPYVEILSPAHLQQKLNGVLRDYLDGQADDKMRQ